MSTQENERTDENEDKIKANEITETLIPDMIQPELTDNDLRIHFDKVVGMRINLKPEYIDAQEEHLMAEERTFWFKQDKGLLQASFVTKYNMKFQMTVYRSMYLSPVRIEQVKWLVFKCASVGGNEDKLQRYLFNDEYRIMKRTAEREMIQRQKQTSGKHCYDAIQNFIVPQGYTKLENTADRSAKLPPPGSITETSNNPEKEDYFLPELDAYPYNFGVRCRKNDDCKGKYFFFCMASAACKKKIIEVHELKKGYRAMVPRDVNEISQQVEDHLTEVHWTQLIQVKQFKEY